MNSFIGKTPFFRLLLPLIAGIVTGSVFSGLVRVAIPIGFIGLLLMLFSFFIRREDIFRFRWLFGVGTGFFLFSLSLFQTGLHKESARLPFAGTEKYLLGTTLNIPETKSRSIAIDVKTAPPESGKIILYLEQTDEARRLLPGDEIVFRVKTEPFRNFGNPDDFDYARYMNIKGFAGTGYVPASDWRKTGRRAMSIPFKAQRFRAKAIEFYRSFDLNSDAYAFICALTLGYKIHLSNDLQEAFRASGTAHVLALSGLHVGIIYVVISFLFSFLGKKGAGRIFRYMLIIATLWAFIFVVGMSASIVRAAIMLTLLSVGKMFHRNGFTFNTLAAAAFFILIFSPFHLFDAGFQMSFGAVSAILFFYPELKRFYRPVNKKGRYIVNKTGEYVWNLLCITLSAQIGVFPIVLFHFGTFPALFFITNLLVVPLTGIIIYAIFPLIVFGLLRFLQHDLITAIFSFFQWIEKTLIDILLRIVYISESIPFAQITGNKISFVQLILLILFIYLFAFFLTSRRSRLLINSLAAFLLFQFTITHHKLAMPHPQLTVFNTPGRSEIAAYHNNTRHYLEIPENSFLPHPQKRVLLLTDDAITAYSAEQQIGLDVLILSRYENFNIEQLLGLFRPAIIVLDSSLPRHAAVGLTNQCTALGIEVHDVTKNGAFSLNF